MTDAAPSQRDKECFLQRLPEVDGHCPKKGLEMSIVTAENCRNFHCPTPFELHYSIAHRKHFLDNPSAYCKKMHGFDKDLAAHFTVIRSVGIVLCGKPTDEVFGDVPREYYLDSIMNDIENAAEEICTYPVYFILDLCRVLAFIQGFGIMSKAQGAQWAAKRILQYARIIEAAAESYRSDKPFTAKIPNDALRDFACRMTNRIFTSKENCI